MHAVEANFDGLVGPTHNYAGLSYGNVASSKNQQVTSNPKEAALQGLAKMKALHDMGFVQGVLAPQARPDINILKCLGFTGSDARILALAAKTDPVLLASCCSASSMWTANAATVSPSSDTLDGKIHITPANLVNKFHRSIEPETTARTLQAVFNNDQYFQHHPPLPAVDVLGDEGAANHTRLCQNYGDSGMELFVFGHYGLSPEKPAPSRFPARHTYEASSAIARLHGLAAERTLFIQQNPAVIDQGVFHNDVIAVGNRNVLFFHEQAFLEKQNLLNKLNDFFNDQPFYPIEVNSSDISVKDAVNTYLFNSQLLSLANGEMVIVVPEECLHNNTVKQYLSELVSANNPITQVLSFDLKQSMQNGGGPACLRLRVTLTQNELNAVNPHCILNDFLYSTLTGWVNKHYRDQLTIQDLSDPSLLHETQLALDELTQILQLGSIYPFQRH
ncbi:N-succinylarginine dihydrolase [Zooshikella ganghwensis]|uniref:N-succinylarginine dihydrolase n=1 Tax=Zooshikella ganghwensis TaxID=202772 RepID=A0A4P9VQC9_9GAMM|nr:N-succinylarginine dihydrolase [Zooshikella ganghwensis]RDH44574.1 N-succinylarginine dihydrolase [Zooshikella ganghwensis]